MSATFNIGMSKMLLFLRKKSIGEGVILLSYRRRRSYNTNLQATVGDIWIVGKEICRFYLRNLPVLIPFTFTKIECRIHSSLKSLNLSGFPLNFEVFPKVLPVLYKGVCPLFWIRVHFIWLGSDRHIDVLVSSQSCFPLLQT